MLYKNTHASPTAVIRHLQAIAKSAAREARSAHSVTDATKYSFLQKESSDMHDRHTNNLKAGGLPN